MTISHLRSFISCIPESQKKVLSYFKLHMSYWGKTYCTPAAMNKQQHLPTSDFQPWQVEAFMVPPGPSAPWPGQTGQSRTPCWSPHPPAPPPLPYSAPSTTHWRKEQLLCLGPMEGASPGLSSSQCIRISAMSPLDTSEHTSAPNIAQLTSRHRPRPANPLYCPSRVLCVNQS